MSDPLATLRAWQRAAPRDRALVVDGIDGTRGVVLRERHAGAWFAAVYSTADVAAVALTDCVRWRHAQPRAAPRVPRRKKPTDSKE